jgi:signal transduction histidine kinase
VLLVFGGFLYWTLDHFLSNSLNNYLASSAHNIAKQIVARVPERGDIFLEQEINETYAPRSSGWFIRVLSPSGAIRYQSAPPRDANWNPSRVPMPAFRQQQITDSVAVVNGTRLAVYTLPYHGYIVQVGRSELMEKESLKSLLLALFLLTPLTIVAAAFGGYSLMRMPLKPVVALTEQAEHVGVGDLGRRLPVIQSGDELERLSLSLNRMISRLEEALSHNQRFCADVSHELRTPLTIMRGEMEHAIQFPGLESEVLESVGSVMEEIERMDRIIENLLSISRFDSGTCDISFKPVELAELATTTVEQMSLLAVEKAIFLICKGGPEITVKTDPVRLRQILVNLLDNAIKYTPALGTVTLTWEKVQHHAVLTVEDTGQGIAPDELPFVFDRFYRTDHARSRRSGGTGLGLSIVKAISTAIAAKVSLNSYPQKGTKASVEIPLWEEQYSTHVSHRVQNESSTAKA